MKRGKPRYRIICDAKGFDEPLIVGWHYYFGYCLVDSFEDELKLNSDKEEDGLCQMRKM